MDRLPPLTALRAFDAAARHLSFAKAAAELNVTPAALSFQIKSLEEHLGHPLFRRLNRAVALTEAGEALAPGARDGFETLLTAWRAARRSVDTSTLTVTAGPAVTAKWLAPRLFKFVEAHPEIELRFSASFRLMDFNLDDIDVALRFGYPDDDGLFSVPLMHEWATPMMTPEFAEQVKKPEDLLKIPLLHQVDTKFLKPGIDWPDWFRMAGVDAPDDHGSRFSQADHAIDAALAGGGALMGRFTLAAKALKEGRLVMPFDLSLTTEAHYRFVCPLGTESRPHVRALMDWILAEAAETEKWAQGRLFVEAAA